MDTSTIHSPAVPYTTAAFNSLPEFDESKGRVSTQHDALDALSQVVRSHNAQEYLGASLIHKHFPLRSGERMVERVAADGSSIAPTADYPEEELTPYLWHLGSSDKERFQWAPVEFVVSETVPTSVRTFADELPKRQALLNDLASVLANNEAQDTFGLALLHRQNIKFDRSKQVLLETPGPAERTLVVAPVNPEATMEDDWTQTYWHFDVDAEGQIAGCQQHGCAGYCSLHSPKPGEPPILNFK